MTAFEPAPETSAVFLTVDATGGAPEELLARTVHTKKRMRLYRALTVGVCALCILPLVTLFVAFDTTVLRYDWLFYAVLAGQLAAAAGVLVRLWSTCRAARRSALLRDAGSMPRTLTFTDGGITVAAPTGVTVLRYADITRVYETREGLLLYCLALHLWLPAHRLTPSQSKAVLSVLYGHLRPDCVRTVLSDLQGDRLAAADLPDIPLPDTTALSASYADALAEAGHDMRVLFDSFLGAVFAGCALATLVFPRDPLLPAAIGAVTAFVLLYGLFSGIQRVNALSARRPTAKKQVYATCTALLCRDGCTVFADGLPLTPACPLSAVTVNVADQGVRLTVDRTVFVFPATEIPQHLLERMNITHG